jgi:hypothetical protein
LHPDQFRLAKPATNDAADYQTDLARRASRYHDALTEIAQRPIPNFPAPPGDSFGPKVKLADVQAMRQIAREALKG